MKSVSKKYYLAVKEKESESYLITGELLESPFSCECKKDILGAFYHLDDCESRYIHLNIVKGLFGSSRCDEKTLELVKSLMVEDFLMIDENKKLAWLCKKGGNRIGINDFSRSLVLELDYITEFNKVKSINDFEVEFVEL